MKILKSLGIQPNNRVFRRATTGEPFVGLDLLLPLGALHQQADSNNFLLEQV